MRWFNIVIISSIILGSIIMSSDGWEQAPRTAKIAFTSVRDGNDEIYVMDADGKNQRYLTPVGQGDPPAAWSPDGKKIAFTWEVEGLDLPGLEGVGDGKQLDNAVIDADGGIPHNLTNHPGQGKCPTWSPDDKRIAFYSNRDGLGIFVMNSDGSNQRRLTPVRTGDLYPDWSPDGKKIAFESSRKNGKADILCHER